MKNITRKCNIIVTKINNCINMMHKNTVKSRIKNTNIKIVNRKALVFYII